MQAAQRRKRDNYLPIGIQFQNLGQTHISNVILYKNKNSAVPSTCGNDNKRNKTVIQIK